MKWKEIEKKYKKQWILVDVIKVDQNLNTVEGNVIAHSTDKEDIYKALLEKKPKKFSIEYTGKIPDDLAVVM